MLTTRCRAGAPSSARAGGPPRRWWPSCRRTPSPARAIDPGYANATSTNQAAAPVAPLPSLRVRQQVQQQRGCARLHRRSIPPVRFSEPLLADWTPKDLTPHNENVEVYTNAEEVELFLNGKSLGTQKLHADATPSSSRCRSSQGR
jgi:hypothetical protein